MDLTDVFEKISNEKEEETHASKDSNPWWEPKMGVYIIKVTTVGQEYTVNLSNKTIKKIRMEIDAKKRHESDFKHYNWGIPLSQSKTSLLGQLSYLNKKTGIENKQLTIIVKEVRRGEQVMRDYTILEAIEMMSNENIV